MLTIALVGLIIVVGVVFVLFLLAARLKTGMAAQIDSLRASGRPGRVQQILALDDAQAAPELSNHVFFIRMREGSLDRLTSAERTFRLVDEVLMEVNNGGFLQYFENSSGEHAAEAVAALKLVGAARTAALLEAALGVFGAVGPHPQHEARIEQIAALSDEAKARLEALDASFNDSDDAALLLMPFVRKSSDQFGDE